jgi:hypothetical protein
VCGAGKVTNLNSWFDETMSRVDKCLLPLDLPVYSLPTYLHNVWILSQSLMQLAGSKDGLSAPLVIPTCDGGIQFEWHGGGLDLEVEVYSSGRLMGILQVREGKIEKDESYYITYPDSKWRDNFNDSINWFLTG